MLPQAERYFPWGTPERKLYELLSFGPATGGQIVRKLRIRRPSEIVMRIRRGLAGSGVTVKARLIDDPAGVDAWEFRLGVVDGTAGTHDGQARPRQ
jgi:hypothetical protein